ncbi:tRNA (N6-threonylcarbamoyladenosine(37)-N6)-methyltransferase TrmO [Aestuariibacter sp. AA17]|uniref:tRNA (N6-threonylcarbamoyladenosine(37)-N6)-methyltransferase TrmO n=1 Tax=Fluctibacter corallii TaxID=2984329 RepID=A0ABT3A8V7_9ALTE|nr:tRNA (N6-threonylcarbamoyladenosine(37)-N6)-methyltransferase TrmO [Aestuariibacter sp. AA17]MCV2885024.1 tRNA (N6-threonylcarbamoyladenosine(37)-N6)-methyltransferase TrmO [Aestuariibacter sp. AA17]
MQVSVEAIATISTPYDEKFAVPRQPGLVREAKGVIEFHPPYNDINGLRGIEQFSHLWLIFQFHHTAENGWQPLVRPPRLGGNHKLGVWATRSTFRPNAIGMSVVKFEDVIQRKGKVNLIVSGMDLVSGTPILDIKPYVPYSDSVHEASGGFASTAPTSALSTEFDPAVEHQIADIERHHPEFRSVVIGVLNQDPRPAYHKRQSKTEGDIREYGVKLFNHNVRWRVLESKNMVFAIEKA